MKLLFILAIFVIGILGLTPIINSESVESVYASQLSPTGYENNGNLPENSTTLSQSVYNSKSSEWDTNEEIRTSVDESHINDNELMLNATNNQNIGVGTVCGSFYVGGVLQKYITYEYTNISGRRVTSYIGSSGQFCARDVPAGNRSVQFNVLWYWHPACTVTVVAYQSRVQNCYIRGL